MADFDWTSALLGGALIGLSATLLMLLLGRIAGISGIVAEALDGPTGEMPWRIAFIAGLIAAPLSAMLIGDAVPVPQIPVSLVAVAIAGALVGFGTRLSNGCTSGHGICGIARLSPRSLVATGVFMAAAVAVVAVTRHVLGG